MQSAVGPSNGPFKYVHFSIVVSESCESTAAVNVSVSVVYLKRSALNKLN